MTEVLLLQSAALFCATSLPDMFFGKPRLHPERAREANLSFETTNIGAGLVK